MDPCIPSSWSAYQVAWRFGRTRYDIEVENPGHRCRGIAEATLDGVSVDPRAIALVDDGGTHRVQLVLGETRRSALPVGPAAATTSVS
jgi:cellobiose phosphorylase